MSDLTRIGSAAVRAYQSALATVSENVANRDSVGFVRRTIAMSELPVAASSRGGSGSGVRVDAIARAWDGFRADSVRASQSDASRADVRSEALQQMEELVANDQTGIGAALTAFFNSATALAADPGSASGQATMRVRVADLTSAIRQTDSGLAAQGAAATAATTAGVARTNATLADLARVNAALSTSRDGTADRAAIEDQRDRLLGTLATSIKVDVTLGAKGVARVTLPGLADPPLIDGVRAATITADDDGRLTLTGDAGTATFTPTGGSLAGTADAQRSIGGLREQANNLAAALIAHINTWSTQGQTLDGLPGEPLLSGSAAGDIALTDAAGGALPVASADGRRNGNLLALDGLRTASGLEASWAGTIATHVQATEQARAAADVTASVQQQQEAALAEQSGVDLDVEAASLLRFQQAHGAAAHILKVAQDTLDQILQLR